jgi:UDP-GlcNAc:undecaprenyl-phosphate GlcNAc-1-phosphate transferase
VTAGLAIVFVVTLATSLLLTPLARGVGVRLGLVDHPRPGELQRWPRSRTGGYGLITAFVLGLLVSLFLVPRSDTEEWYRLTGFVVGLLVVIVVAFFDDRLRIGPFPQLAGQVLAALLPVPFGLMVADVSNPLGQIVPLPLVVAVPFTVLWVVGMINTLNWLDTMDGLAGGVALIAALVLLARTIDLGQYSVAVLPLALVAACLGFLPFNFNPARVFMGTSGSMFLGYALAMLAIFGGAKLATAAMVLGLPILDTAFVIIQRLHAGRSPFHGGDDAHLTHKLFKRGWSVRRIVLTLYAACLALGLGALASSGHHKLWIFAGFALALAAATVWLVLRPRPIGEAPRASRREQHQPDEAR